jgi:mono/diheme cytochrome c family protein
MPMRAKVRPLPFVLGLVLAAAAGFAAAHAVRPVIGADTPAGASPTAAETLKPAHIVNPGPPTKAYDRKLEFAVFNKNCTQCHVSVADPERPGKTRDEWYRIVNLMEGHGLVLTQEEADMIVDLLFKLRTGVEDQAG